MELALAVIGAGLATIRRSVILAPRKFHALTEMNCRYKKLSFFARKRWQAETRLRRGKESRRLILHEELELSNMLSKCNETLTNRLRWRSRRRHEEPARRLS